MPIGIVFIRGINVGGKNILPMADLRSLCEKLGLQDPCTYIQSGNLAFKADARTMKKASAAIADAIESKHGFRPSVVVRTLPELQSALAANPFASLRDLNKSRCLIMFLASKPPAGAAKALQALDIRRDKARLIGLEAFLNLPDGIADAALSVADVESTLGVPGTCRNLNTVEKMLTLAQGLDTPRLNSYTPVRRADIPTTSKRSDPCQSPSRSSTKSSTTAARSRASAPPKPSSTTTA
jgi:uncharacterized protein (DUF1697 family)